jgi:hypothetical protein
MLFAVVAGVVAADSSSHSRLIAVALGDGEEEED